MQKTFSSLKNKIVKRNTLNDENLKDYKSTNINILLNRVRVNKKKEFQKKILFTTATSLGAVLFGILIFWKFKKDNIYSSNHSTILLHLMVRPK